MKLGRGGVVATAALLALPSAAQADVFLNVPVRFLGGPIRPAPPVPQAAAVPAGAPLSSAIPPPTEADIVGYPCDLDDPRDCVRWLEPVDFTPPPGERDEDDPPFPDAVAQSTPAMPPALADAPAIANGLISPAPEAWLRWQTPLLRWRATPGASHYNVQVFRGARLVTTVWTRASRLRVPPGVLKQGRTYVWVVWSGRGGQAAPAYDPVPVGRATFQVTLRPRLVFRRVPGAPGRAAAEVRPHIPFGRLAVTEPGPGPGRIPAQVTLSADGRITLPIPVRVAERLTVTLSDRGPAPPLGLRAP